jgi:hypothetical protein
MFSEFCGQRNEISKKDNSTQTELVSEVISNAIEEARRTTELSVQEEMIVEMDQVNSALEEAKG